MRIIVTGAAGFIGAHLTKDLLIHGHDVLPVDNFSNYYSPELKRVRETDLVIPNGKKIEQNDLSDIHSSRRLFSQFGPESIVHLAAQPGVRIPVQLYDTYARDNLFAFSNVAQLAIELGIKNFVYASSSSVYGDSEKFSLLETEQDMNPRSYYGATKLANEILAKSLFQQSQISSVGLRFFTVYGPYGRPDMAYFRLIAQALDNYQFKMFGDGSIKRDFTFIDDTVTAIRLILEKQLQGNKVLNVGGGKPSSMSEMIQEVELQTGSKLTYEKTSTHENDVKTTNADTTAIRSAIGFVPEIDLCTGISKTIEWAKDKEIIKNLSRWAQSVD